MFNLATLYRGSLSLSFPIRISLWLRLQVWGLHIYNVDSKVTTHRGTSKQALKISKNRVNDIHKLSAHIFSLPVPTFIEMLRLVCIRKGIEAKNVEEAEDYFNEIGLKQGGVLTIENFKAANCPSL
jgi:hypothetical protein